MFGKHNLKGINIQFTDKFLTDGTYNLIIGYRTGKSNQNTAEQLEVDIPVEMFRQVAVWQSGIRFQDHQSYFATSRKIAFPTQRGIFKTHLFGKEWKWEKWVKTT